MPSSLKDARPARITGRSGRAPGFRRFRQTPAMASTRIGSEEPTDGIRTCSSSTIGVISPAWHLLNSTPSSLYRRSRRAIHLMPHLHCRSTAPGLFGTSRGNQLKSLRRRRIIRGHGALAITTSRQITCIDQRRHVTWGGVRAKSRGAQSAQEFAYAYRRREGSRRPRLTVRPALAMRAVGDQYRDMGFS